jgi:hypothetical protein
MGCSKVADPLDPLDVEPVKVESNEEPTKRQKITLLVEKYVDVPFGEPTETTEAKVVEEAIQQGWKNVTIRRK